MTAARAGAPLLVAGLGCRCPRCGKGPLFNGYLTIAPACNNCGLSFAGNDTGDGPAFFIMLPLCILMAVMALVFELKVEPPLWVHMVLCIPNERARQSLRRHLAGAGWRWPPCTRSPISGA